jgi:hypothetical protein
MISQMNKHLCSADSLDNSQALPPAHILTSAAHVKFVMELVGHGLALPIHQIGTISQSVTVYTSWLTEPKKRPLVMTQLGEQSAYFQEFLQVPPEFNPRASLCICLYYLSRE